MKEYLEKLSSEFVHYEVRFKNLDTSEEWSISQRKLSHAMMEASTDKLGRIEIKVVQIDDEAAQEHQVYYAIIVNHPKHFEIAYKGKVKEVVEGTLNDALTRLREKRRLLTPDAMFDYVIVGVNA